MGKNSAKEFVKSKLNLDHLKVPSACNTDFELLEYLCKHFKKKIHISLGMTTKRKQKIFNFFKNLKELRTLFFTLVHLITQFKMKMFVY